MPTGTPGRTHGSVGTYIWGCRCDACKDANRRYYGQRPMAEHLASIAAKHGTESKYNSGCRCEVCKAAAATARRERRHRDPEATRAYYRAYSKRRRTAA